MSNAALPIEATWLLLALVLVSGGAVVAFAIRRWSKSLRSERLLLGSALVETAARLREHRDEETQLRLLLDALPDPVVQRGPGGVLVSNAAYARLLTPPVRADDRPFGPLVVRSTVATVRPDGTRDIDEAIETPDGVRWFSWSETEMVAADGVRSTLRIGRESTDRRETERGLDEARSKAEAANEAKSRFLATVSHEFRTPLSGILGMSDLLLDTDLDGEQTSYVQGLRSSAAAFMSLIEEILDFSKIEAGRIDLADEPFEIEALVQGVAELLGPRAQDKGIEIACYVGADVPATVRGDRDRLRQVLFNLAGNAVKFTQAGGVGVSVETKGGKLVFTVQDTGPGIEPDRIASIFDEFEQGGLKAARGIGTGLGLAITRRIVDSMEGAIEVASEPGRGSTFRVILALPAIDAEPRPMPAAAPGFAVLIVGAGPFGADFLARRLGETGARCSVAKGGPDAGAYLRTWRFDLVIVDWALGGDAARQVAAAARQAGVPRSIVLLSPFERREFGSPHGAGFDAYLMKPVRTRSLLERQSPDGADAAIPRTPSPATPHEPNGAAIPRIPRILLAEDDPVNALLAVTSLKKLGAFVDWARDGHEALAHAQASLAGDRPRYDLVLMDMRMPGLDGLEVTRRIREQESVTGGGRGRIVALTASLIGPQAHPDIPTLFDGFLSKPFSFEAIAAELRGREVRAA